mgnify:CR=1 FL=1
MLGKVFRFVKDMLRSKEFSPTRDVIRIKEQVVCYLIKDGKNINTIEGSGNTWLYSGCQQIAYFLTGQAATYPTSMSCNGSGGTGTVSIYSSYVDSATVAVHKGSFPASGQRSDISAFFLTGNVTFASISVDTFTKNDGIAMEIVWRSTITGV